MADDFYQQERRLEQEGFVGDSLARYTAKTFLIMFFGLIVTFSVAYFGYSTRIVYRAYLTVPGFHIIVLIAELAVVVGMTAMLHKLSATGAAVCFFIYSFLTGVAFSTYFLVFNVPSMILVFAATALYFGGMAVFGFLTGIDLSRIRTVLFGGLIFLILANVLMLFIPGLRVGEQVLCSIGVVVFLGYTAYDTQKIKTFYSAFRGDEEMLKKAAIFSALQLYLDFVNLFLYLLRIFGKKKN